ncbi:MAG: hemolysin family protein [Lachnospiraceae bacterium]|nr:hemolysin family protein [Lachnospiraceae bacterium]
MDNDGSSIIIIVSIVYFIILIINGLLNAYCSALDNLNESLMEEKAKDGDGKAMIVNEHLDSSSMLIDSLHLIDGLCFFITGTFCIPSTVLYILNKNENIFGDYSFVAVTFIVSVIAFILMLSAGYASLKIGGVKKERAAMALCKICNGLFVFFTPLRVIIKKFSGIFVRVFGVDPNLNLDEVSEDEIISMVDEGHEQGVIESSEAEMIHNIFEFTNKDAGDIMTHRKNMILLSGEITFSEALNFLLENSLSRYPVYLEDADNIIGVVHIRDFMERQRDNSLYNKKLMEVKGLIREISFIPQTRNISDLFHSMQEEKSHMVIVVDEYGQTCGLVTMEDILEEIVGNIFDEYDEEIALITPHADGSYDILGMTPLDEVEELLDANLPVEDYDTLNGYLISLLDRIPSPEEKKIQITTEGFLFEVLSVENKTIKNVHVTRIMEPTETENNMNE